MVSGLKSIGIPYSHGDLERLFAVTCDPDDRTVSLHGLDFLLRVLKCSTIPEDPNLAADVDTCMQALEYHGHSAAGDEEDPAQLKTMCSAAQGLCNLSRHGDETEARRRQRFMYEMGALPILLSSLHSPDGNLQFWCAVAATKVVDDFEAACDGFVDAGGLTQGQWF